jgi:hypothetical protein
LKPSVRAATSLPFQTLHPDVFGSHIYKEI